MVSVDAAFSFSLFLLSGSSVLSLVMYNAKAWDMNVWGMLTQLCLCESEVKPKPLEKPPSSQREEIQTSVSRHAGLNLRC